MRLRHSIIAMLASILTLLGLVCTCLNLTNTTWKVSVTAHLILLLLVIYYALLGYKKPHGNLLKYIMLLFAFSMVTAVRSGFRLGAAENIVLSVVVIILVSYMAGRLDRVKQNRSVTVLVLLLLVCTQVNALVRYHGPCTFLDVVNVLSRAIIWLDIGVAYLVRYDWHKRAGLTEEKKEIAE